MDIDNAVGQLVRDALQRLSQLRADLPHVDCAAVIRAVRETGEVEAGVADI